MGESFRKLVIFLRLSRAILKDTIPPNFVEKTFVNSEKKPTKFMNVFFLKSFRLYGILPRLLHYLEVVFPLNLLLGWFLPDAGQELVDD